MPWEIIGLIEKSQMEREYIAKYYDDTIPYYKMFVHRDSESNALHYGFWDKHTSSYGDALINENKFLAKLAMIGPRDHVLDAGCGIGGSSIWLAKNIGCSVTGINISTKQIEKAKMLAIRNKVSGKIQFLLRDYLKTEFNDESFEVVWAIESVCHADKKIKFFQEAYRILKKGGRLVVADGLLLRSPNESERGIYKDFLEGLALPNLSKFSEFEEWMREAGFVNIKLLDKTTEVKKTSKILYLTSLLTYPLLKVAHLLGLIPETVAKNVPAGIAQYKMVNNNLAGYGVFFGEKP